MCGRYQFTAEQCEEIIRIAREIDKRYGAEAWSPGEIRPTNRAPVLVAKDGEVRPELQTWGYKMPDSLIINARAETAAEKPMFRESVAAKRCVIYPHLFSNRSRQILRLFWKCIPTNYTFRA